MHVNDFESNMVEPLEPVTDSKVIDTCCIDCQRLAQGIIHYWCLTPQLQMFHTYRTQRLGRVRERRHTKVI